MVSGWENLYAVSSYCLVTNDGTFAFQAYREFLRPELIASRANCRGRFDKVSKAEVAFFSSFPLFWDCQQDLAGLSGVWLLD
jgi:hypothetical protein